MHLAGHEICSHGYRWINYQNIDEATEREHIRRAICAIETVTGERPLGWYTGRTGPNTHRLVAEEGGFLYNADDYSDEDPVARAPAFCLLARDCRALAQQVQIANVRFPPNSEQIAEKRN